MYIRPLCFYHLPNLVLFPWIRLSIVVAGLWIGMGNLYAETTNTIPLITLSNMSAQRAYSFTPFPGFHLNNFEWRYAVGDSINWSLPTYNDSHWKMIKNPVWDNKESIPEELRYGIVWYRLHIRSDSSLIQKVLCYTFNTVGAYTLFINGKKILENGIVSPDAEHEYIPGDGRFEFRYNTFTFSEATTQVITVRYSINTLWKNNFANRFGRHSPLGLRLAAVERHDIEAYNKEVRVFIVYCGFAIAFLFLLVPLQAAFFLARQNNRAHIIAITACVYFAVRLCAYHLYYLSYGQSFDVMLLAGRLNAILIYQAPAVLMIFVVEYFRGSIPKIDAQRKTVYIIAGMFMLTNVIMEIGYIPETPILRVLFWLVGSILIGTLCIMALRQNFHHSVYFATGVLVAIVLGLVSLVFNAQNFYFVAIGLTTFTALMFCGHSFLPLMLTISIVKKIIQQNITLQEYSGNLEKKVHERTLELQKTNQVLDAANEEIERQLSILTEQARDIEVVNSALMESNAYLDERAEIIARQNDQLNTLNKEKDAFLSIVAHDLKNPLTSIMLSAEVLKNQASTLVMDRVQRMSERIYTASVRMHAIIDELLDINVLQSGSATLTLEYFNPLPALTELLEVFYESAKRKDIQLHFFIEHNVMLYADQQRFLRICENLLSNAIKYSPKDRVIWFRVYYQDGMTYISVQDQGQGLTESDMNKIFARFSRLSAQPTAGEHSSGLGLSIVKQMVEVMGGTVWAESPGKNQGATFIVRLPSEPPI